MSVGLFHVSTTMDDMHSGKVDCPFMAHQEAICPMDLSDHISALQSVFTATLPEIITLYTFVVFAVAMRLPSWLVPKRSDRLILYRQLRERTYTFPARVLQEIFARGILHPKLYFALLDA